jgi:hypothetical protein
MAAEIDELKDRLRLATNHPGGADVAALENAGAALRAATKAMDEIFDARRSGTRTGLTDAVEAVRKARRSLDRAQK